MNKVVEEIKKTKVFYVATIDGRQPRVRPFSSITECEGKAYLCTGNFKEVYKQIISNPNIELCGMLGETSWLRVSATCMEDNRLEVQEAMLADETGPKGLYKAGDGRFVTFRLDNVVATKYSFTSSPQKIEEYDKNKICQSCGMPIASSDLLGSNKDGGRNEDYCKYCYDKGEFIDNVSMEEYIEMCSQYGSQAGMTNEQMREYLTKLFPTLKRWKKQ